MACEYERPTFPSGSCAGLVISNCAAEIVSDKVLLTIRFAESETATPNVKLPVAPGVPEITPEALTFIPGARVPVPRLHEYRPLPPAEINVCEYAVSTLPAGKDAVVI